MIHSKYFLAIIPPEPIYSKVYEIKEYVRDRYNCKAPLRSPPHITLHMPFQWKTQKEKELINKLVQATKEIEFAIDLTGFGAFPPRVIYVDLVPNDELLALQGRIVEFAKRELNLFNADRKDRPYRPHVTVAFRDLKKDQFEIAWDEFSCREFSASFRVNSFWLLKHDGKKWQLLHEFQFSE